MEPELQPGGRDSTPGPFHRPAHGCLALVIKPSLALALPTEKLIWLSFQSRTRQTNLNRKFYLKTQAPWVADPGLTCTSIFTPKHAFSPRSPIWNLKAACSILGPTSGLGGVIEAVFVHTGCSALCPPPSPPPHLLSLPALFHPHNLQDDKGVWKEKTTGLGREAVAFISMWFPIISRKAHTNHRSLCQEGKPAFLQSTLDTKTWDEKWLM